MALFASESFSVAVHEKHLGLCRPSTTWTVLCRRAPIGRRDRGRHNMFNDKFGSSGIVAEYRAQHAARMCSMVEHRDGGSTRASADNYCSTDYTAAYNTRGSNFTKQHEAYS